MLVAGQDARQRTFRAQQGRDQVRDRQEAGPPCRNRAEWARGGRRGHRVGVGRGQGIGKEARHRPLVGRDQRQHRLLQPLVERRPPRRAGAAAAGASRRRRRAPGAACGCEKPSSTASSGRLWLAAPGSRMRATSSVSRISMRRVPQSGRGQEVDVEARPVADRLATAQELGQARAGPTSGLAAPRSSSCLMPVRRRTVSGTARPGSTRRSMVALTRSGVKATAPTSMTRSRAGSRPVVSRSRAAYSGKAVPILRAQADAAESPLAL